MPPVGKSGPLTTSISSMTSDSGLSMSIVMALQASPMLCGGMFVDMPTAMPLLPLIRRFGILFGSTIGSSVLPSKFCSNLTVSMSMSRSISSAILAILASVYRMAAAGSPSMLPKLPWPSTSMYLRLNHCASLTRVSYTAWSPWGWYLPSTSPTILAHFRYCLLWPRPSSCIE